MPGQGSELRTPIADRQTGWVERLPGRWRDFATLARWDRPIGTWLLLLPCWWGQALADASAQPVADAAVRGRCGRHARCRLHRQRPRRPRLRPAGGAHPQPAAGGRPDRRARGRCCSSPRSRWSACCVLAALNRHRGPGRARQRAAGRRLPVHEADHLLAAGVPGHHLQLGRAGRLRRGRPAPLDAAALLLYAAGFFWTLGYDTHLRAPGQGGRRADRGALDRAAARRRRRPRWLLAFYAHHAGAPAGGRARSRARAPCSSWRCCRSPGCCCARSRGLRLDDAADCLARFRANRDVGLAVFVALVARLAGADAHGDAGRSTSTRSGCWATSGTSWAS